MSDVDEETSNDDILSALGGKIGFTQDLNIENKNNIGQGVQLVTVTLPSVGAKKITESKLRIG